MKYQTDDLRIREIKEVSPPEQVRNEVSITNEATDTVFKTRNAIHNILHDQDDRMLLIIGPCSIHDPVAAMEYAQKLNAARKQYEDDLLIVMREIGRASGRERV